MKSFAALSLAAAVSALPQASTSSECSPSSDSSFQITTVNVTSSAKRSVEKRQLDGTLTLSLEDGVLKDQAGRQGYIASNYQFQFDAPPQPGHLDTEGFGLCGNDSISLKGSTVFYQCQSGDFYNLYSQSTGAQCIPIHIQAVMKGSDSVTQVSDGQPQATSAGQVVSQISDGQPQASSAGVVTQISDGQPQASAPVVTQISDGQPQASAPAVVTQISDGQPQASAPAVVTQISDGQPQASAPGVVTQISDGQPQAPVATGNTTVPNVTTPAMPEFTGGAATAGVASLGALAAGLFGLFALL